MMLMLLMLLLLLQSNPHPGLLTLIDIHRHAN